VICQANNIHGKRLQTLYVVHLIEKSFAILNKVVHLNLHQCAWYLHRRKHCPCARIEKEGKERERERERE
jgi:hypothetical protein